MENHPHGRLPFSTVQDTLLCHTWFVMVFSIVTFSAFNDHYKPTYSLWLLQYVQC